MDELVYRIMQPVELASLREIDRTERIESFYIQHGDQLEESAQTFDVPPWAQEGDHDHTLTRQRSACEQLLAAGGAAVGAFDGGRLVGIGIVLPHIRPEIAQLAYLHVSDGYRGQGIGLRLVAQLERLAIEAGDTEMVVSATPSANTVHFYLGRGYAPMAEPLPELYALEPEDVHLSKRIG